MNIVQQRNFCLKCLIAISSNWGCRFFNKCNEEKNLCSCKSSLPSELHGWSPGKHFWLFCILSCSKHRSRGSGRMNGDASSIFRWIFTLLRVWGYEIGIPNRYTGFKTALDTALDLKQCFFYLFILLKNIRFASFTARHLWKRIVLKNCVKNNWKKKICEIPHTCRKGSSCFYKKSTNQTFTFISSKLVFFKSLWSTHI